MSHSCRWARLKWGNNGSGPHDDTVLFQLPIDLGQLLVEHSTGHQLLTGTANGGAVRADVVHADVGKRTEREPIVLTWLSYHEGTEKH